MKNIKYIIMALFAFLLVACEESNSDKSKIKNKDLKLKELTSKPYKELTTEEKRVLILLLESKNKQSNNYIEGE